MQAIILDDYIPLLNFVRWFLHQLTLTATNQTFLADILFTGVATFMRSSMLNIHIYRLCSHDDPHSTIAHAYQESFSINVWAGIVYNNLPGSYILPRRLTDHTYRIFLQKVLAELLDDVPSSIRRRMWFCQMEPMPHHFNRAFRNIQNAVLWEVLNSSFLASMFSRFNLLGLLLLESY